MIVAVVEHGVKRPGGVRRFDEAVVDGRAETRGLVGLVGLGLLSEGDQCPVTIAAQDSVYVTLETESRRPGRIVDFHLAGATGWPGGFVSGGRPVDRLAERLGEL